MAVVEDIGSFPLPEWVSNKEFNEIYPRARDDLLHGKNAISSDYKMLNGIILESFEKKLESGIDVVTYPQHYDMHRQFLEPIELYQNEPFLIKEDKALLPEIEIIKKVAPEISKEIGKKILLRSCVTGPVELYLRTEFGSNIYKDVLENLARSTNYFLKNSTVKSTEIKTSVLCLDEPSLGYTDLLNIEREDIIDVLEKTLKGIHIPVELHLHTLKSIDLALEIEGISSITAEFAASPENINLVKKKDLERHDKFLRAGITRTNIDSIIAETLDRGVEPEPMQLIDDKMVIKKRIEKIYSVFGESVSSWGPDCGLGSWPTQYVANELLRRTAEAVKESFK